MSTMAIRVAFVCILLSVPVAAADKPPEGELRVGELRVPLEPAQIRSDSPLADFSGLADEQDAVGDPPARPADAKKGWRVPSQHWKTFPFAATIDLGRERNLSALWLFDTNAKGDVEFSVKQGQEWKKVASYDCGSYLRWVRLGLDVTARHLRIELKSPGANFAEIVLYEYSDSAHKAMLDRKAREAAEQAEKNAALQRAREEAANRPWVELPPFGRLRLVDEVDLSQAQVGHLFRQGPGSTSRVETVLDRPCRVLAPQADRAGYFAVRLGRYKLLRPGAAYVLAVEYPEDRPRSFIVTCGGCETSRGFHTGATVGDALHPKYVNNNPESLRVPLSRKWEAWTLYFHLHDRFPDLAFIRGDGERKLTPDDGFDVAMAHFSAPNDPTSAGPAVARIRLLEVPDGADVAQPVRLPPADLPRRHVFWREEMADGVIGGKKETERGLKERLDWYRFKLAQMRLLGIRTFTKDLLEFGACQHWDPTEGGGNNWVHFNGDTKDLWGRIVELMGREGMSVLPYYEYAGSKGYKGLGYQRRCKPLTRDDAYTHIKWVESANADVTDPDTLADFRKMIDLTVLKLADKARFEGVWIRPRWQLPMSFADATRSRFARQANGGQEVTREQLRTDAALLKRYEDWWFAQRREFLAAVRDHLRARIPQAVVLYTAEGGEPGTSFPTWEKRIVTDDVPAWGKILADPVHVKDNKPVVAITPDTVVQKGLYLEALQAAPLNWGGWEVHHANPPADPQRYRDTPGVLLTHCIHRYYSAASPRTFDAFRGPAGLAVVRHLALNENMMFDASDQPLLGYFVCDFERAGPYCMMTEAMAVANGDPTMLGYLYGGNLGRGFPRYVRRFNAAFLALPALPGTVDARACDDKQVVVRVIKTDAHGTYLAVVNTGLEAKTGLALRVPAGAVTDAASGAALEVRDAAVRLDLDPFELRAILVK